MSTEIPTQADIYGVADVLQMIDGQSNALFAALGKLGLIGVTGRLGLVRVGNYPTCYGVELRDQAGSGDPLYLDIPKTLQPKDMEGKVVEAFGFLHAKKGLRSTALQVSRLRLASDVSPVQVAEDKALRAIFGKANAGVDAFPTGELLISYIHGRASAVTADFLGQLRRIPAHFLDPIEVNLREPGSIREGVERARGSVVCLLRGGGADADFEVFNHPDLLDAWRDKAAFKITALGHTQNTTLLDRFSHKVSKTPTEAGTWIIDQIEDQINRQHWQQQAQEAGAAAQKAAEDAAQRLEALHRQYQASLDAVKEETARKEEQIRTASQRLTEEAIRKQEALQSQVATSQAREAAKTREIEILRGMRRGPLPRWVWPVIVAAAWLGLLVGWLFTR